MGRRRVDETYQARRAELLDAAWSQLSSEGFAATSLNGFLARSGISKGAFYHYFDSWQDLLEGVVDRVARNGVHALEESLGGRQSPPLDELNEFIGVAATRPEQTTRLRGLLNQIHRSADIALLNRLFDKTNNLSLPILERIIEDGIAEKQFDTPYPTEAAENILHEWNRALLKVFELLASELPPDQVRRAILHRTEAAAYITERLLGLERRSVKRADAADIDRIVAFWSAPNRL